MRITVLGSALAALPPLRGAARAGDPGAGAAAFDASGCIGCHGAAGKSPTAPANPLIGGKTKSYIAGGHSRFRSGQRQGPAMNAMASMPRDADIANIAAYLDAQQASLA